jgi:hypothetical protein
MWFIFLGERLEIESSVGNDCEYDIETTITHWCKYGRFVECTFSVKAMLHGAIFLATCNAILLLRDVKLPNTSLHYTPLMFSHHIENSSLISLINISQE